MKRVVPEKKKFTLELDDIRTLNFPNDLMILILKKQFKVRILISEPQENKIIAKYDVVDLDETSIIYKSDTFFVMGLGIAEDLLHQNFIEIHELNPLFHLIRQFILGNVREFLEICELYEISINNKNIKD